MSNLYYRHILIPFLAFLVSVDIYLFTYIPCGISMSCTLPRWILGLCCGLYWLWFVLHHVVMKLALKNNPVTPILLFYDNQVAALNVTWVTSYLSTALLLGDSEYSVYLWILPATAVFFSGWEELHSTYSGSLLAKNTLGCILVGVLCIMVSILGPEYFSYTTVYNKELRVLICYILLLLSVFPIVTR